MSPQRSLTLPPAFQVVPSVERRRSPAGLVLSITLHVLIGAILLLRIRQDFVRVMDTGSPLSGKRGGGGGGGASVAYISIPAEAPRAAAPEVAPPVETPPPVPVEPTPDPVVTPPPVPEPQPVAVAASTGTSSDSVVGQGPGQGGGAGGGTGGGQGPGVGPGSGPGEGTGGDGGKGKGPVAKHLILPPTDPPKELRGELVEVTFFILVDGTVDKVSIKPEIKDRKFAKRLDETMRGYRFTPATNASGIPVASVYTQTMRY